MEQFTLERTGKAPLRFQGELLAESGGKWFNNRDQNRWHDLSIYRTAGGQFVAQIVYQTQWQGENSVSLAEVCQTAAEVVAVFQAYDPTAQVVGYPPGDTYAAKQLRLLTDISLRYGIQVSWVLGQIPEAAEEIQ